MQEPEVSRGRTVEVLGPGFVEPKCVERRPVGTRAEPPRSPADPASGDWIRGTCDMHRRDRLDGVRLGYSVGPGRFSRPFPDDLPELLADGGTNRTAAPPTRPNPEPPGAETRTPAPPLGNAVRVEVGGTPVAVFNVGGELYAIGAVCPHEGGPLEEGEVENGRVTCPWHGSVFDLKTGKVLTPPARNDVPVFAVRKEGDLVILTDRK